jgi:predicted AAA+ superfamily ATPase
MRETVDCGIVMTGSNASVLSSEFSTFLTGRHRQVRLAPLSFGEFLVFRGLAPVTARRGLMPAERAMLRAQFNRYAELGGFPEVVLNEDLSLAQETFRDIVQRDLVARFGIRNVAQYRALALYLASNTGTRLSLRRLKEMCGVRSENCVKSYLDQFRSAYLFPGVRRFSHKVREVELSQAKTYCVDHGMARSVSFRFSGNRGALLENLVFNVLATRHEEVFYLETARGREVDFITRDKGANTAMVQVCADLDDPATREREVGALKEAMEEHDVSEAQVVTWDFEGSLDKGIRAIPAWRWTCG